MSVTCGFFNSINSDRRYDAHQISGAFQGALLNGVLSSIGNGFACQKIDDDHVRIRSGFGYFNGYYIYNTEEAILEIPEDVYPMLPITGIRIVPDSVQTEYPYAGRLDLGDIRVEGITTLTRIDGIRIVDGSVQTEYPYGGRLDLGDITVEAYGEDYEPTRLGDCYIVIRFLPADRKFDIEAISTGDYDPVNHYIIAICHNTYEGFSVENRVGLEGGAGLITGINQVSYIDDIIDYISSAETNGLTNWNTQKTEYWNYWLTNNAYYLHHQTGSTTQYTRLTNELRPKEDEPIILSGTAMAKTTALQLSSDDEIPTDAVIDIKHNSTNLIINNITVEGNTITLEYDELSARCTIKAIIR